MVVKSKMGQQGIAKQRDNRPAEEREKAFPVEVGARRVEDIGGQTVVKKKSKDIVAVMPGCLKPYFYAVLGHRC